MYKRNLFLGKTNFFATVLMIFLALSVQGLMAQNSTHGAKFTVTDAVKESSDLFKTLKVADTTMAQFKGKITNVCQKKGCWMKVELKDDQEVFVRFKDYGFFVPMDSPGKEVVMNGKAFIEEMSVADQRHYAEDKGATAAEIAKITEPKRTLRFEADGVQISE